MFAFVPAIFFCQDASSSFSAQPSQASQEVVEHWDVEKQMMFYTHSESVASTTMPLQTGGTTYYATSSESEDETYFPVPVQVNGTTYFYSPVLGEEPAFASAPVQVNGTTYFNTPSVSSASEEFFNDFIESDQSLNSADDFESVYDVLRSLILTEEQLRIAGYPAIDENGEVKIQKTYFERDTETWIQEEDQTRKCSRCRVHFAVGADGRFPVGEGICQYTTNGQRKTANHHITIQRFTSELQKFVETPAPAGEGDSRGKKIFALDAEMVATTAGFALARLSVVDLDGQLVMDVIVKPEAKIVDCLTEFSGITMEMMENASHTLETCRDMFLELVNADSILIGHGLESDLKALRLVHRNVIDTSIIYQMAGRKVALRVLAKEHLGRTIQADNASTFGHCSTEDALASLDLAKHRAGLY